MKTFRCTASEDSLGDKIYYVSGKIEPGQTFRLQGTESMDGVYMADTIMSYVYKCAQCPFRGSHDTNNPYPCMLRRHTGTSVVPICTVDARSHRRVKIKSVDKIMEDL